MFGGDNSSPVYPNFLEEDQFQFDSNVSTQLQLFGNFSDNCSDAPMNYVGNEHISVMNCPTVANELVHVLNQPVEKNGEAENISCNCSGAPVNYMGNEHISVMNCPTVANELVPVLISQPAENNMEAEDISRQRQFHISLNNSLYQDDAHCLIDNLNPNPISTGRRLSYDDEEHNSYVTEASTGMIEAFPIILPVNNNLGFEIDRQHEELDHYIRLQENHIATGLREMKQRQLASVLGIIENEVNKKLQEKEIKVEIMTLKNRELADKIQQVTMEAQSWQHRAKYNESVVNVLKSDLKQAIALSANQPKEGYGDSEVENEASSYIDHNNRPVLGGDGRPRTCRGLTCKTCKINEVSILFLPCRHLCLCEDCEGSINVCPVCQSMKAASVQVFMP